MTTKINHLNYFYKDSGQGETVLLVHGNPDSAYYWDDVVPFLNKKYRCIAPDLPGFGRSDISDDFDFSLRGCQAWFDDFISSLQLDGPFHIIIHDVGAFYAITWAINHPDKVKSICITNTLFFSDYRWHIWGRIWRTPILGELSNLFLSKWLYKKSLQKGSPKLTDAFLDKSFPHITPKMQRTVLKLYRAMSPHVFKGWEDKYLALTDSKPVLVIWGERDPYIPLRFGYAERMANGQTVHRIPDVGHWVAAEVPQQFAEYWLGFVEECNRLSCY